MIREIIEEVGYDNILKYLENEMKLKGLYIRVSKERSISQNDIFITEDEEMCDIELKKWFQKREYLANYLNADKSVVKSGRTPKIIMSCVKQAVIFNYGTIVKNINDKEKVKKTKIDNIDEYIETMVNEYFLELSKYEDNNDEKELIIKNLDDIKEILKNTKNIEKTKVNIYIDDTVENYKVSNKYYIDSNILNKKNQVEINENILGVSSAFLCVNIDKPLLKMTDNTINDVPSLNNTDNAVVLRNTLEYLKKHNRSIDKKDEIGTLNIKLHYKNFEIIQFENNPYNMPNKLQIDPVVIRGICKEDSRKEFLIENPNVISAKINSFMSQCLFKKGKEGFRDLAEKEYKTLPKKAKSFRDQYKETIDRFSFENDEHRFKAVLNKMNKSMIEFNILQDSSKGNENVYMSDILEYVIGIEDYFYKTNKVKEFIYMRENVFEKLKNIKETGYKIESDEEFLFIIGQLSSYLISKSKAKNTTNKLKVSIYNAKTVEKLKYSLSLLWERYGYDLVIGSRENKIYAEIMDYSFSSKKIQHFDKNLMVGLNSDNLFYKSTKEKKDEE